ncbi:FAD-binding oxidoreductase [Streptomyces sp. NBC_01775]|uniref:NAD(P)/FAD-dependent oxidoreductase n=1 Tax=Streptomyces sp. NBC_01775 TaxID=2975939 RepID=UPI002DD88961|nr:FAD-dependent oxidoreductase [Streptomyces sp. NBC_01775]WSB75639.1 FAD-binding oxidoreductase [Streptomyces sp. NBC_01775]
MEPRRIVIIGAGALGATLAHRLTESATTAGSGTSGSGTRVEVVLLDRERPARGTSRWSLAWLNSNGKTPRAYHDLSVDSMAAWERLAARTDGEAWYRPVGNLRWADDEEGTRRLAERVEQASAWGYAAEFVDRQRVADLEPALDLPPDIPRVAWFPSEGYVLTEPLIASLVRRAQDRGADVRTGPAGQVTAVEGGGTGVRVVRTADGGTLEADTVVCCAGRWTPEVTRLAGAPGAGVPIVDPDRPGSPAPALVVRVGPVRGAPTRVLHTPLVHLRAHGGDGPHGRQGRHGQHGQHVHLEAGDVTVDLHTPDAELDAWAGTLLERARRLLPALADAEVLERKVCVRPLPLDGLPVVGPTAGEGSPYVVVTHSGVTLAAGLAEHVAEELLTGARRPALAPFRPDRFTPPSPAPADGRQG